MAQLSAGSCMKLHNAQPGDEETLNTPHTLQFLSIKKVTPSTTTTNPNPAVDRYRIIVSDGIHFLQAMLATQLNHLVDDAAIGKNTIARIEKLTCNSVQDKRLFIILALTVVATSADKVGSPEAIKSEGTASASPAPAAASTSVQQPRQAAPPQRQAAGRPGQKSNQRSSIYPIEGLSPYQNSWMIKARVTQKSEVKTWSNQRGEGKLFSVNFMDESGEIKGTAFNSTVDHLYDRLEEGKVYYVSQARVNLAKKKFSNLPNDYELSFTDSTVVEECLEAADVPTVKFNFVKLSKLEDVQKDTTCDVIGVIKETGELGEIISKNTQKAVPKRELTLVDETEFSVRLTLWGKQAESYNVEENAVVAFKGVKVGDFGGRSLSMFSGSTMQVNPEIDEAYALRGWFDAFGANGQFKSHSSAMSSGSTGGFNRAEMRNLNDVKESQIGMSDKAEYFSARATLMHIKAENPSYPACRTEGCSKKVFEANDGWRCEKCDKSFEAPEHRYIISICVADWSGQAWLQGFNDAGVAIFGMSANQLVETRERDEQEYNTIVHNANCATFNFSCRAKQDTYNEQTRVRYGITRISPLNYREEANALRDLLHSAWAN